MHEHHGRLGGCEGEKRRTTVQNWVRVELMSVPFGYVLSQPSQERSEMDSSVLGYLSFDTSGEPLEGLQDLLDGLSITLEDIGQISNCTVNYPILERPKRVFFSTEYPQRFRQGRRRLRFHVDRVILEQVREQARTAERLDYGSQKSFALINRGFVTSPPSQVDDEIRDDGKNDTARQYQMSMP
jgi:hypothetical protein